MAKKKRKRKSTKAHEASELARARVLRVAKKRGSITHRLASKVGRWEQGWYHLDAMRRAGLLTKDKFNVWRPR
jgi:hypothetical protein